MQGGWREVQRRTKKWEDSEKWLKQVGQEEARIKVVMIVDIDILL